MFSYSPLSREKRETRFFRFSSTCQPRPGGLSLELQHGSLDDEALQYRALSYVWVEIEVNGEQFLVGENLHALLRRLHDDQEECWLWADAICIQQSDDEEKSWHVQRMGDIFKNAEMVYSWLGHGSEATDVAMDFFEHWGPRAIKAGVMESRWRQQIDNLEFWYSIWKGQTTGHMDAYGHFDEFVSTLEDQRTDEESQETNLETIPYFDPAHIKGIRETDMGALCYDLIFQETALARQAAILCGTRTIMIEHFEAVLGLLWMFRDQPHLGAFFGRCPVQRGFYERLPSGLYPNKAIRIRQSICRQEFMTLSSILLAFSSPSGRPWYRATDPRDIVYGVFGLLTNDDRCSLGSVDYQNRTWVDLFAQATRRLIVESLTRTDEPEEFTYHIGFCLPRPRDQPNELPSWVPDWRDLPGYRVDMVSHVMAYDYAAGDVLDQDRPGDWLACIRQYTGLSGNGCHMCPLSSDVEDHVWLLALGCNSTGVLLDWLDLEQDNTKDPSFLHMFLHHSQDYYDHDTLPDTVVKIITELLATPWRLERFLPKARSMMDCTNNTLEPHHPTPTDSSDDATATVDEMAQVEPEPLDLKSALKQLTITDARLLVAAMIAESQLSDDEKVTVDETTTQVETGRIGEYKGALEIISISDEKLLIAALICALFCHAKLKQTTFFKTEKGMVGNGIGDVRPGDMLVISQNVDTPFILHPRQEGGVKNSANSEASEGYTLGGEAWVDGIMEGEFMETNPSEEVFDIY
ncbi:heterokaryon incompatibility protein-domain-containing protein [Sordaria brevicollis]|uniref:Heterokaryon incompatibility protein-domain-containing protein n=1 Tax=Sordaria brevicollis TaxID=83679 RepID=A0AAE0UG99_SORBR|nr:heterokaryon incompatibility protein-domain-containing protein [Sordaria brevicollis]